MRRNSHTSAIIAVLKLLNGFMIVPVTKTKPFGEKSRDLVRKVISCFAHKVAGIVCPHSIRVGQD